MIRPSEPGDFEQIWTIINDGARVYRSVIPSDRLGGPYTSKEELRHENNHGFVFWGCEDAAALSGVVGIRRVQEITVIRHAYLRTDSQNNGIGAPSVSFPRVDRSPVLIAHGRMQAG